MDIVIILHFLNPMRSHFKYTDRIAPVWKIWLAFLFTNVQAATHLFGQTNQLQFEHFTVETGLSQGSVLSIAQDSTGFIWFGTKDGLNKYDSQKFEVFRHQDNNPNSISCSTNIHALLTDRKGNLWVGTQRGLNKYIAETNSFIAYFNRENDKLSLSNNVVRSLCEDRAGNLWIGTEGGLNKMTADGKFERFFCKGAQGDGLIDPMIKVAYQDNKNAIWVGSLNGLARVDIGGAKSQFKTFFHLVGTSSSIAANDVKSIAEDLNGNLWIGTHYDGLDLFDRANGTFTHFKNDPNNINSLSSNTIRKITVSRSGDLWIATLNGIDIFNPVTHSFKRQHVDPENPNAINQNSIYSIFEDKVNSMWVGTYFGGINVYHPDKVKFNILKHYSYKNSLSSNIISTIVEDNKDNLWIGTEAEGLNFIDKKSGKVTNYVARSATTNGLSSNLIKAVVVTDQGDLWVAAYEGGLDRYSSRTRSFKNYQLDIPKPGKVQSNRVSNLLIDFDGQLWIGTNGKGLYLYNKKNDNFISLKHGDSLGQFELSPRFINCLFQDRQHTIWVATSDGVFCLTKNSTSFKKFKSHHPSLLYNVSNIQQGNRNVIWFGTSDKGLLQYDQQTSVENIYDVNSGLPSNNISGMIEDNDENLWVSTDNGLAKKVNNRFKIYTTGDGLPGNVFNNHSFFKDKNGNLYFGGYNGMVSFKPEEMVENNNKPKVIFTRLQLFNKTIALDDDTHLLHKSLTRTEEISFSSKQNIFTIDVAALNFVNPKKNSFAYKLDGLEKNWNSLEASSITFNNLPDGTFTLLVKGTNNDGIWCNEPAKLIIHILPPVWRTWWAYTLYTLTLCGVFFAVTRYLLMKTRLKDEHIMHQMKLEFFTNVSHEIRTPLTLITGPLENLIEENLDNTKLSRQLAGVNINVKRLHKLVNELMDFRKSDSGKMKLNIISDNIVAFVREIHLSFQEVALERKINYEFITENEDIKIYFDKNQLEKVIFNLLSNAFRFVPVNGYVGIEIKQQQSHVWISVKDSGPGIPSDSVAMLFTDFYQAGDLKQRNGGSGIGLSLSKKIAEIHSGQLLLDQSESNTCFRLILNTGFAHFKKSDLRDHFDQDNLTSYVLQTEIDEIIKVDSINSESYSKENKPVILVIEDNLELRTFIAETLGIHYTVLVASDGAEGFKTAADILPDVIISDLMMPVMDGMELCRAIKSDERTSHIPVMLLTARSGDIYELEGLKNGADIYLTKPFSLRKLQLKVNNLIKARDNMRKKFTQHFSLDPSKVVFESTEEVFLNKILILVEENISNTEFNVNEFAAEIGMSTPIFYKKVKALTGLTVNNFIKSIRLKRAVQIMEHGGKNVSEVAYMVGFSDPKYFSKEFHKQYGVHPSKFN
jgi:ligand-binding sensor domain-containing protein/DNA-binding response OmpR family regulator